LLSTDAADAPVIAELGKAVPVVRYVGPVSLVSRTARSSSGLAGRWDGVLGGHNAPDGSLNEPGTYDRLRVPA